MPGKQLSDGVGATPRSMKSAVFILCVVLSGAAAFVGDVAAATGPDLDALPPLNIYSSEIAVLCATALHADDYTIIRQLPSRLSKAKKQGHKGWDTGNTAEMQEATYRYNDTLIVMIRDLAKTFYAKGSLPEIDAYLKALYTVHRFKQNAGNPTGEFRGTMTYLDVPSAVSEDLESTISDMVHAIVVSDLKFDYIKWKKTWQQALKQ